MVKILLVGCLGRMGRIITGLASGSDNITVVEGADQYAGTARDADYPVRTSLSDCDRDADVLVDFSNAGALSEILDYICGRNMPAVLCATGYSPEQLDEIQKASEKCAILRSSNMSIGINLIEELLEEISGKLLEAGFDCEIIEKHHNQKLDAPSGTAISLGESVRTGAGKDLEFIYDRSARRKKRPAGEIGFSSVRGGTIVGEHEVIFAGTDEVITLKHEAFSRAVFGKGALEAAAFLKGKGPGMYSMRDVLK